MDREETGDEETTVHVEAWMENDRVLICFYVDPEDLGGGPQTTRAHLILVAVAIILPAWMIISAYNKRVNQIEELRKEVEKLKQKE